MTSVNSFLHNGLRRSDFGDFLVTSTKRLDLLVESHQNENRVNINNRRCVCGYCVGCSVVAKKKHHFLIASVALDDDRSQSE